MSEREGNFEQAVGEFFSVHAEDPREAGATPRSVLYHERMSAWLEKIAPEASEALRLAARCQHIRRWKIPRASYPEGRLGYKKWRHDLAVFHGDEAAVILKRAGYSEKTIERVRELLLKTGLKSDPEAQALEDVICLVFLENEFAEFAGKHDEEKIAVILRKTWKKMSPKGHEEAQKLAATLPEELQRIIGRALAQVK